MGVLIIPLHIEEYNRLMQYKYSIERVARIVEDTPVGQDISKQRILDVLPEEDIYEQQYGSSKD